MRNALLSLVVIGAPVSIANAQTRTITVDDSGGADFTDLQAAIDAATDGDVVLARDGDYTEFAIHAKAISVIADAGATVRVLGAAAPATLTSSIESIPTNRRALVRGLTFVLPQQFAGSTLAIQNCSGTVWIEDVVIEPPLALPFGYRNGQNSAVFIDACSSVVLIGLDVVGPNGAPPGFGLESGSMALRANASTVHVHGSRFAPGGTLVNGGMGRPGMELAGGTTVLVDSRSVGAPGGSGFPMLSGPGNGGPGVRLSGGASLWSFGSELVGGPPGTDLFGGTTASPGPRFSVTGSATVNEFATEPATLSTTAIVREDNSATLDLQTAPNASLALFAAFESSPIFVVGLPGFLGVGTAPIVVPIGSADGAGTFSVDVLLGTLPTGLLTYDLNVQIGVLTTTPSVSLSNPSIVTVVEDTL